LSPDPFRAGTLEAAAMSAPDTSPTVVEVMRFEDLPLGSRGTRRAIARWSDGSESEALTYFADLCGHPHKSSYAETVVIPRTGRAPRDRWDWQEGHPHNPRLLKSIEAEAAYDLTPNPARRQVRGRLVSVATGPVSGSP
jgi:hypothetical protein